MTSRYIGIDVLFIIYIFGVYLEMSVLPLARAIASISNNIPDFNVTPHIPVPLTWYLFVGFVVFRIILEWVTIWAEGSARAA